MSTSRSSTAVVGFEQRLQRLSQIFAFVGPIGIYFMTATGEYFFADYYSPTAKKFMTPILAIVGIMLIARIIRPRASRARLAVEYGTIITFATLAYSFFLHFPSPYMLAGGVFAVLVCFDFGLKWAIASLFYQYVPVFIMAIFYKHYGVEGMLDIVAYVFAPAAFAYLVVRLQQLARQEIASIDRHSARALHNEQQVQSLINNIDDGVIAINEHNRVVIYNAAALNILDTNTSVNGKLISSVFKPLDANLQPVDLKQLLASATSSISNRDLRLKYQDGSIANIFIGIAPIYLGYGQAASNGYTIILRDITREKSLEEERDEFISVVSHELRTPIAISEGNISNAEFIVNKGGDGDGIKNALKEAHHQVLFLADMINDLSTLSRAERGVLQVDVEAINVHDLMVELGNNYRPQAEAKGLKLDVEIDPKLELLLSSKLYSREILQNLITNAIKYTEKGQVTLRAHAQPKGVRFEIEDTGIGISKGDQERVYDKFFRSEDFRTRQSNGTGLGLYVTIKLARLIHAEMDLTSELNKGSTFSVFMPNLDTNTEPTKESTSQAAAA